MTRSARPYAAGAASARVFEGFDTEALRIVMFDLGLVANRIARGSTVYVPRDGLGTGLSELPSRAPSIANLITAFFRALPGEACSWEIM